MAGEYALCQVSNRKPIAWPGRVFPILDVFAEGPLYANQISVVLYGHDAHLLELRKWFLHGLGYRVVTAMQVSDLDAIPIAPPIALITLCHTISAAESEVAAAKAAARWPGIKTLSLARNHSNSSSTVPGNTRRPLDAATHLSSMISQLVGHSVSSPYSHTY
jgi:hypothetical protein